MIKKFFSNALLSVVMDKTARKRLETIRTGKDTGKDTGRNSGKNLKQNASSKTVRKAKPNTGSMSKSDDDILKTIAEALEEARREIEVTGAQGTRGTQSKRGAQSGTRTPASQSSRSQKSVRAEAIKRVLENNKPAIEPTRAPTKAPTTGREKLIAEAMSIHKKKAHIFDELDPVTHDKLLLMAQYTLDPDSLSPEVRKQIGMETKTEGLVDNIGRSPKSSIKRRTTKR